MTPCEVHVEPGRLVYWQGQQRGGTVTGVPKWQAMAWLRSRFVVYVMEPVGDGDATCSPARGGADERLANRSPAASPPQPPTDMFAGDSDDAEADSARDDKTAGQRDGWEPSRARHSHRNGPGDFAVPRMHEIGPQAAQQPADTMAELGEQRDDGRGEPARTRPRTHPNPYGPGRCPNCGSPVSGRRKWCGEACRLQAYRERQR
jgi:hypothetical protein